MRTSSLAEQSPLIISGILTSTSYSNKIKKQIIPQLRKNSKIQKIVDGGKS